MIKKLILITGIIPIYVCVPGGGGGGFQIVEFELIPLQIHEVMETDFC